MVTDEETGVKAVDLFFAPPSVIANGGCQHEKILIQCVRKRFGSAQIGSVTIGPEGTWNDILQTDGCTFQPFMEPGQWRLVKVTLQDGAGNSAMYCDTACAGHGAIGCNEGLELGMSAATVDVTSPGADTTPPVLQEVLKVTPSAVDVSSSAEGVQVKLMVTDEETGVKLVDLFFAPPSVIANGDCQHEKITLQCVRKRFSSGKTGSLTVGPEGTWNDILQTEGCTFQPGLEAGQWRLVKVTLQDGVGNSAMYCDTACAGHGGIGCYKGLELDMSAATVDVTSQGADTKPPVLQGVSKVKPTAVDVSESAQGVQVELMVTDEETGVKVVDLFFAPPSVIAHGDCKHEKITLQCNRKTFSHGKTGSLAVGPEGTWNDILQTEGCTFQPGMEAGQWRLVKVTLKDVAGNSATYCDTACAGHGGIGCYQGLQLDMSAATVDVTSQGADTASSAALDGTTPPATVDASAGAMLLVGQQVMILFVLHVLLGPLW